MNPKWRKVAYLVSAIMFLQLGCAQAQWGPEDRAREISQINLWRDKLLESTNADGIERLKIIKTGLVNMAYRKTLKGHDPEIDILYVEIQKAATAIPGHAEFYRDKLDLANDLRKAAISNAGDNDVGAIDHGVKRHKFMDARQEAFQVLRNLPSPETVRVLGHYLDDEWVSPVPLEKPHWFEKPLASHAAEALEGLPLVNKPVNRNRLDRGDPEKDLRTWQQWHEQIKSGKRTFRFEGDPTEYDLNGPAPEEKLVRIERDRKRDEERANRSGKNGSVQIGGLERFTSSPGSTAGIIAAVLGIIAAGWYFWRKKAQAA